MKIMYKIISATGIQGVKYYNTYEEARAAADVRYRVTLIKWYVQTVIIK